MVFAWMKQRRRRRLLAQPLPEAWRQYLSRNVPYYRLLSELDRRRLGKALRIVVAEKRWEGCGGLEMSDEIRVTIAGTACLLILGVADFYFDGVQSILVYPDTYSHREQRDPSGVVRQDVPISGEAWHRGPVVLAWGDVLRDLRHPHHGRNVVLHEFAHQLDGLDGEMGGTPPMPDRQLAARWDEVFSREYRQLVEAGRHGIPTLLDPYAATSRAEFFAVSTEFFFNLPGPLRQSHPALYDLLKTFYCQDPASWG